jgi:hypothetical protein
MIPMITVLTITRLKRVQFHLRATSIHRSNGIIRLISTPPYKRDSRIRGSQSPIQLLLPPGLCSVVCPILTTRDSTLEPSPTRFVTSLENGSLETTTGTAGLSIASISGLGGAKCADFAVTKDPYPSTLGTGPIFGVSAGGRSTGRNDSVYHSYHTWRWLVRRHMETRSSELLGKYNGSF